jgi:hypothetical protein
MWVPQLFHSLTMWPGTNPCAFQPQFPLFELVGLDNLKGSLSVLHFQKFAVWLKNLLGTSRVTLLVGKHMKKGYSCALQVAL